MRKDLEEIGNWVNNCIASKEELLYRREIQPLLEKCQIAVDNEETLVGTVNLRVPIKIQQTIIAFAFAEPSNLAKH